ncbi:MAG: diguanylate cyclase [Deltaproteobacteria bacterium]|nr:diguanylate cyclase [Deltaproteobacteria bacterium]MBW2151463.1 diguanylate cyclase [Deltaproteobacteria bacterium]
MSKDSSDGLLEASSEAEIRKMKLQLEQFQTQRDRLLKQLSEWEERDSSFSEFYRNSLLMFVELLRTKENRNIHRFLDTLKQLLKDNASIEKLEAQLRHIKDVTLKETSLSTKKNISRADRLLNRFSKKRVSEKTAVEELKKMYSEIIEDLKLNLDEKSLKNLKAVEDGIQQFHHLEDFSHIRNEIILIFKEYVSRISGEREEAAAFIREIGKRLLEVESHILDSFPYTEETHKANTEFNTLLEKKIGELRKDVDFSQSLAELKQTVVSSLSTIQKAIDKQREKDRARMKELNKRMELLQNNLQEMKSEISAAKDRAQALEHEALVDPLTSVYNRRAYEKRIREELQRFLRHGHAFSLLLMDVDHFKSINDKYGHTIGDLCLKEIIKRIRPLLRESDFLARFGGEEFVVLLPETKKEGAKEVAEKLRQCIEKTEFIHRSEAVEITISIGVTQVASTDINAGDLFKRVDAALYEAKKKGRNKVVVH